MATGIWYYFSFNCIDFPGGSDCKETTCNAEGPGSISGLGRSPGEGHGNSLQYSCLEDPHEQRSLEGCSLCSHKESDVTERLSTAQTLFWECGFIFKKNTHLSASSVELPNVSLQFWSYLQMTISGPTIRISRTTYIIFIKIIIRQ